MKLSTLSQSLGSIWVAITTVLEPEQRRRALLILENALADDAVTDPYARIVVEALSEDTEGLPPAPWAGARSLLLELSN
jgi:hypothetical protein